MSVAVSTMFRDVMVALSAAVLRHVAEPLAQPVLGVDQTGVGGELLRPVADLLVPLTPGSATRHEADGHAGGEDEDCLDLHVNRPSCLSVRDW